MSTVILFYILPILLIAAAVLDLGTMTLPNWLTGAIACLFPVAALAAGMPLAALGLHVAAGAVLLLLGMALFATGKVGAGDGKLLAALGLWTGFGALLPFLLYAAIFGGVFAVLLLFFRRLPLPVMLASQGWVARLHTPTEGIPYGVALAAAALLVLPETALARLVL